MTKFTPKKPKLKDYGLTEKQVQDNEFAKNNRQRIINENNAIDEKAKKYGVTTGVVIAVVGMIITAMAGVAQAGAIAIFVGVVVGAAVCGGIKSKKQPVPTYSSVILNKYKQYQEDLKKYNKELELQKKQEKEAAEKKKEQIVARAKKQWEQIQEDIANGVHREPFIDKIVYTSQSQDLEKGMIVNHPKFGHGKVMSANAKDGTCYIQFDDDLSLKKIMYKVVPIEILEFPKEPLPKLGKDEKVQPKTEKKVKEDPITKTYSNGISLTKSQEKLFNELFKESQKYCLELQVSEWKQYVGVGVIGQEHLRYWLTKRQDRIYVRFANTSRYIPLSVENRFDLINFVRQVNEEFEENPETFMLASYKKQLEKEKQAEKPVENPVEPTENVEDNVDDEIFGVDDEIEMSEENISNDVEQAAQNEELEYDKKIFTISGKTITKFFGVSEQSNYSIPNGVEENGANSFSENNFVYELEIPSSVKKISDCAFKNCKKLRILELPRSIEEIGVDVFAGCDNLETIFCYTKAVRKLLVDVPKHIEIVCLEF